MHKPGGDFGEFSSSHLLPCVLPGQDQTDIIIPAGGKPIAKSRTVVRMALSHKKEPPKRRSVTHTGSHGLPHGHYRLELTVVQCSQLFAWASSGWRVQETPWAVPGVERARVVLFGVFPQYRIYCMYCTKYHALYCTHYSIAVTVCRKPAAGGESQSARVAFGHIQTFSNAVPCSKSG